MKQKSIFEQISKKIFPLFKHKNNPQKQIILFSGVPASGKTSLAKILERRYNAVRINKDKVGRIIKNLGVEEKKNLSEKYIYHLIKHYPFQNKRIILDKSIDRTYKKILCVLRKQGFKKFIIRIKVSKKEMLSRIRLRNKKNICEWLAKADKWFDDFEKCENAIRANFAIQGNFLSKKSELTKLFLVLDEFFKPVLQFRQTSNNLHTPN